MKHFPAGKSKQSQELSGCVLCLECALSCAGDGELGARLRSWHHSV